MHKVIRLISNFLHNKNMPPSMKVHVHWMNLMKNQIKQKFQSLEILKEKVARQKTLLKTFHRKIVFDAFKMSLSLDVGHMCMK